MCKRLGMIKYLLLMLLPLNAFALSTVATYSINYVSTNVTTLAWLQLDAATTQEYDFLCIYDTSGSILKIAIGAAGSEVLQFYIPVGGNGCFPTVIPIGSRIAIEADNANATTGMLRINALY